MQDLDNRIKNFGEVKIDEKTCDVVLTRKKDKQAQIMLPHISSRSVDNINLKLLQTINDIGKYIRGCCMLLDAYNSHDNTLAVTSGESETKCIRIIDIQSKQIKKLIPVNSYYYGIGVTDGKFICSTAGKGIQLINPNNNSIIDIVRDDKIPRYCYVAIFDNKIYHTNLQTNTVTCYDQQGTVQWTFKNEDILRSPSGISVDNDGNVYVIGELSNHVVVISADGQQFKKIATASDNLCDRVYVDYNRSTNQLLV
ncbi:unnamed protein product [Mytilus edulis]|uniref:Uncharacterized protein n=1 Tax=Mytilus edulis TaxID=6550 RepID=A0A8S3TNQ5_MYTED|nr:unnamed protein product [Mytilus edulis]